MIRMSKYQLIFKDGDTFTVCLLLPASLFPSLVWVSKPVNKKLKNVHA